MLTKINGLDIVFSKWGSRVIILNVSSLEVSYDGVPGFAVVLSLPFMLELVCNWKKVLSPYDIQDFILNLVKYIVFPKTSLETVYQLFSNEQVNLWILGEILVISKNYLF